MNRTDYMLYGLIRCALCGAPYVGEVTGTGTRPRRYYRCRSPRRDGLTCAARALAAAPLEDAVWKRIKTVAAGDARADARALSILRSLPARATQAERGVVARKFGVSISVRPVERGGRIIPRAEVRFFCQRKGR